MVDLEKVRRLVMKSFDAIADGNALDELVYDHLDLGREMVIGRALTFGEGLSEDFNDTEFEVVRRAFARFKEKPPSRNPRECCAEMVSLAPRRAEQ